MKLRTEEENIVFAFIILGGTQHRKKTFVLKEKQIQNDGSEVVMGFIKTNSERMRLFWKNSIFIFTIFCGT